MTTGIRARLCLEPWHPQRLLTQGRPSDDQPKKRSKSAERVALETGVGELNGDYQVIRGSEECLFEIGDARQTRHCLSDLHKQNSFKEKVISKPNRKK